MSADDVLTVRGLRDAHGPRVVWGCAVTPPQPPKAGDIEQRLIRRLERLAREWPEGYTLASLGGTLCLFRTDDRMIGRGDEGIAGIANEGMDEQKVLWDTTKIPNTGGDW